MSRRPPAKPARSAKPAPLSASKLVVRTSEPRFAQVRERLEGRGLELDASVEPVVRTVLQDVRKRGDAAVVAATKRFDRVAIGPRTWRIGTEEMRRATRRLPAADLKALRLAAQRIRSYHRRQVERSFRYRDELGVELGQEIRPLQRVGVYVPGGLAFYPSSLLMNAIPARVAGVKEIVVVSPPHAEGEPDSLLAAAHVAGVDEILRIGGAQAVGALAFGTATIPRVDKIVGPGNQYVATAKRLVSGFVGIDMVAGPSEVLVVADAEADPNLIAADLLAQAEHGSDSTAVCVTPSAKLGAAIERALDEQLAALPRAEMARRSLASRGAVIVTKNLDEAIDLANRIAPEHLELAVANPERLVSRIHHAGAIFLGHTTPEAFGDYLAGPNHVLPTGGSARFASPLGVYDFVKRTSVIRAPLEALARLGPPLRRLAEMEGLSAHAAAVGRRLVRAGGR